MKSGQHPTNTGADYNAFGRDPYGWIAGLCALLFGPSYIPQVPNSQFVGLAEPPRYGPPAHYQLAHLPAGFIPYYPDRFAELSQMEEGWFLKLGLASERLDLRILDAVLACIEGVCRGGRGEFLDSRELMAVLLTRHNRYILEWCAASVVYMS